MTGKTTIRYTDVDDSSAASGRGRHVIVELYRGKEKVRTLHKKLSVSGNPERVVQLIHSDFGIDLGISPRDIWTGTFHNEEIVNDGITQEPK